MKFNRQNLNSLMADLAAVLHKQGVSVIPVPLGKKKPALAWKAFQTAPAAPRVFQRWFTPTGIPCATNWAIVTGAVSNLVAVDTDSEEAETWAQAHLPETPWMVRTSKGFHRYYRHPGGKVRNGVKMYAGDGRLELDIRGDGGYCVAPYSIHPSGFIYETVGDWTVPRENLPVFDVSWLIPQPRALAQGRASSSSASNVLERARLYLQKAGPAVEGQGGDAHTYRVAALLVTDFELSDKEALGVMLEWNQTCVPPWSESDLCAKIASARKSSTGQPGRLSRAPLEHRETPPQSEQPVGKTKRPFIIASSRQHYLIVDDAIKVLAEAPVFLFGDVPVAVRLGDHGATIKPHNVPSMRLELSTRADWFDVKNDAWFPTAPPDAVTQGVLAHPSPPWPVIERLTPAPLMGRDGSLDLAAGYHPGSRTFYAPGSLEIPPIPERPTREEAQAAARFLCAPFVDFPFVAQSDRANLLAMIVQPFARALFDGPAPMSIIVAPTQGTGKSLLAETAATIFAGVVAPTPEAANDEEMRKRVTAYLMQGSSIMWLDNINRRLDSGALAALITAPLWCDRILGSSTTVRLRPPSLVVATGNNLQMSGEIARRINPIRLDSHMEQPHMRTSFRIRNLVAHVQGRRGTLVAAALTMLRAWVVAGRPSGNYHLGSFEGWAAVLGGILDVAGVQGFLGNLQDVWARGDAEGDQWRPVVEAWWTRYGFRKVGVAELYDVCLAGDLLAHVLGDGGERSQRSRLGRALQKQVDRVYNGRRITAMGCDHAGLKQYALTPTSPDRPQTSVDFCRLSEEKSAPSDPLGKPVSDGSADFADFFSDPMREELEKLHDDDHVPELHGVGGTEKSAHVCATPTEPNSDAGLGGADLGADLRRLLPTSDSSDEYLDV